MDWLKLLMLLVAVASSRVKADGPKKKIRIHLPQTVKHIHHHKKIYITNHPATTQYAPAFMPSADGAVAVPTNIALPSVANIVPLNSVDLLEESVRVPRLTASGSKLLPLYHARGYYGPTRSELVEHDYDIAVHPDSAESYIVPTSIKPSPDTSHHSPKRIKVVKAGEIPRKTVIRKVKPKRVPIRSNPSSSAQQEDEHPVSTFHEQFYSDLQDASTIRKIRKPPRVEKIVDGNTEHIHTYSEEHVHKVIFDEEPRYTSVVGVEPLAAMPTYTHSFIPLKNTRIVALASDPYQTLAVPGSMGTPSQYEYAAYNPREVTHDHIFHDHGEIPDEIDVTKDIISLPPKVSYSSQGIQFDSGLPKRIKNRYPHHTRAQPGDYTYYENIYSSSRVKPKSIAQASLYTPSQNENSNQFKPVSTYRYKDGLSSKSRNKIPTYYGKPLDNYRSKQETVVVPAPFSVQSKIIHDYKPNLQTYIGTAPGSNGLSGNQDPFANFKDSYVNNFEYDNYPSPFNALHAEDKSNHNYNVRKDRKKSTLSQSTHVGSQNRVKYSHNLPNESYLIDEKDDAPSALENLDTYDQSPFFNSVTEKSYSAKGTPSPYQYYTVMSIKALSDDQLSMPEASNDNYQYAEAPTIATTTSATVETTIPPKRPFQTDNNDLTTHSPEFIEGTRHNRRYSENKTISPPRESVKEAKENQSVGTSYKPQLQQNEKHSVNVIPNQSTERRKVKYGDKI